MNRAIASIGLLVFICAAGCWQRGGCAADPQPDEQSEEVGDMKAPEDFASIDDQTERSRAMFTEMGKVLQHPRCTNCHPTGDEPLQGDASRPHQPMVQRGNAGMGRPGMRCNTCHGTSNYRNVPGFAGWRLAPADLGWADQSLADICKTLKGPGGSRSLEPIVSFIQNSHIVAYGWSPPSHYESVPGTRKRFAQLARAWVDAGAHCPNPDAQRE